MIFLDDESLGPLLALTKSEGALFVTDLRYAAIVKAVALNLVREHGRGVRIVMRHTGSRHQRWRILKLIRGY